jgi:sugar phosphate isomerase/epimerase
MPSASPVSKGVGHVFVAASTSCFPDLTLKEAFERLVDLEFSNVEIVVGNEGAAISPEEIMENPSRAALECGATRRMTVSSYFVDFPTGGEAGYEPFEAVCKLAKATKVVTLTVPSSPLGTPFNEEVERYKELVRIANHQGVRVGMLSSTGAVSQDPDTVSVICDHVKGLALSLDPSHFIWRRDHPVDVEKLCKYVHQVYLRDTTRDELQVRVGQGVIDYGKLVNLLGKYHYQRSLCIDIRPQPDVDHLAELRKLRLLLESLLV